MGYSNFPGGFQYGLTVQNIPISLVHTGQVFYVSSTTGSDSNPGTIKKPFATVNHALDHCTASKGDIIYLMPGHAETISAAGGITCDVAGVFIIGLGMGSLTPTFTWSATASTWAISAANVYIANIKCTISIDEVVKLFYVTGAYCTLDGVDFAPYASGQAIQFLLTTNAADYLTVKNCYHRQMTAAGSAQAWIQLVGTDSTRILDNTFLLTANASTSSELISGSTAVVDIEIARNRALFLGATINSVINLVTGSTGIIYDNRIGSGTSVATAGAITGDACYMFENYWIDDAAASGILAPVAGTD